jgi:dihydrofolate synthase/folylpolyglutamate synthase
MDRYQAILDYLYNRLPMFQRTGPAAYKHSLGNTLLLDDLYGHPHRNYPTLHVAGTNGKGSVSHMLAAVLQSAGYKTGLYTSPHLVDFRERIRINGKMIPKAEIIRMVGDFHARNRDKGIAPSFFELTAAMAFDWFARRKVDIAVIEVGLGGRLDSTNIIIPEVSIITNISFDHMALLGHTLPEIAAEKAGIIKAGIPTVISQWQPEVASLFEEKTAEQGSPLFFAGKEYHADYSLRDSNGRQVFNFHRGTTSGNGAPQTDHEVTREEIPGESGAKGTVKAAAGELGTAKTALQETGTGQAAASDSGYEGLRTDLTGGYQRLNIPAVLTTVELLRKKGWKIPREAVYRGLENVTGLTGLQGRWQVIGHNPLVICDTGHNEAGIREVVEQLKQTPYRKLHFILGVVADKDATGILAQLPKEAIYYFTRASIPRALDAGILKEKATPFGLKGEVYPTVATAFRVARETAGREDLVFVGGSNFVVAEVL